MNILIILLFLLLSSAAASAQSLYVDGRERTYIIHIPKNVNSSEVMPLVIALHGGGGDGKGMQRLTGFNDISDRNGFAVVYPDGIDKQWNDGRQDFHLNPDIDDVKFISSLIDSLRAKYGIDTTRIYVTGMSNGATMTFRLACELSYRFAAFAPVSNSMPVTSAYECRPRGPLPVFYIFGKDDPIVPYEGGDIKILGFGSRGKVIPVEETVNYWVKFDSCTGAPLESTLNDKFDGTEVTQKTYSSSKGTNIFQYWLIKGGGHTWPGGPQYLPKAIVGKASKEFDASEEIWKFFKTKKLNRD